MRRSQTILLCLFALVITVVAAYIVGSSTTEQRRTVARAELEDRLEKGRATAAAWHEAAKTERDSAMAPHLSSVEVEELNARFRKASESGWEDLAREISQVKRPWPPELLTKINVWLSDHEDLLAQARALAERGADMEIGDDSSATSQEKSLRLNDMFGMTRLLAIAADARALEGRVDEALDLLADTVAVGDLIGAEPIVSAQVWRQASYDTAMFSVQQLLSGHQLSRDRLDKLEGMLDDTYQRPVFAAAVANEARFGIGFFDEIRNGTVGSILRPFVNMNEVSYVENMTALAEVAGQPYYECASRIDGMRHLSQNLPFTQPVSRSLLRITQPGLIRNIEDQARVDARIDLARIAIALEREYQATGAYPSNLESIAGQFGGELPRDPFTGEPFHYRLESYGFVLYSVGNNQTDEGGTQDGPDVAWWGRSP